MMKRFSDSISSLPQEILCQIFRFCSPDSLQILPLVCQSFYHASTAFPFMTVRELLYRLYHGDLKVLDNTKIIFDEAILAAYVQEAFHSETFRKFYEANKQDNAEFGKYLIAWAYSTKVDGMSPSRTIESLERLLSIVRKGWMVVRKVGDENARQLFLKHAPLCFLDMIHPEQKITSEKLKVALQRRNIDAADLLLKRILCETNDPTHRYLCIQYWFTNLLSPAIKLLFHPLSRTGKCQLPKDLDTDDTESCVRFLLGAINEKILSLDSPRNKTIMWSLAYQNRMLCEYMFQDPNLDPSICENLPIQCAIEHKCSVESQSFVIKLLEYPGVDPSIPNNHLLYLAADKNYLEIVTALLAHPTVQPSGDFLSAIMCVRKSGFISETIKFLLRHPKFDLNVDQAYLTAAGRFSEAFVVAFLNHLRLNPSVKENFAVRITAEMGHLNALKLILNHPRFDPTRTRFLDYTLHHAVWVADTVMTKFLLSHPCFDPTILKDNDFYQAFREHKLGVIKVLLQDGRVDPSFETNRVFYEVLDIVTNYSIDMVKKHRAGGYFYFGPNATRDDFFEIGKLLLNDVRVKRKIMLSGSLDNGYGLAGTVFEPCLQITQTTQSMNLKLLK